MSLAISLHVLAATIWVGGMFFAYLALRPAALLLEPAQRLPLWVRSFAGFFPWVWLSIIILPVTGYWMIFQRFGSLALAPAYVHIMNGLGSLMILIYLHVFFAPYRRLKQTVSVGDFPRAAEYLGKIRLFIGLNLSLGLLTIVIGAGGRYLTSLTLNF